MILPFSFFIIPGITALQQRKAIDEKQVKEDLVKKIPLGRLGTPEEVANLVLFLASSRSDYMTGQAVNLSGGSVLD